MIITTVGAAVLTITAVAFAAGHAQAALPPGERAGDTGTRPQVISARVVVSAGSANGEAGATPPARADGGRYIETVEWIPHPSGRRLAVYPTDYARYDAPTMAWPQAWDEVVRLEAEADHANMRDQFRCHVEFARIVEPDKPSWNLERWRPHVSYLALTLAGCNPD